MIEKLKAHSARVGARALILSPSRELALQTLKVVKEFGSTGEQAIAGAAEWGNLSHAQVNVALRYYGDFPEEVDARIAFNREETERQYAAWQRTQQALA